MVKISVVLGSDGCSKTASKIRFFCRCCCCCGCCWGLSTLTSTFICCHFLLPLLIARYHDLHHCYCPHPTIVYRKCLFITMTIETVCLHRGTYSHRIGLSVSVKQAYWAIYLFNLEWTRCLGIAVIYQFLIVNLETIDFCLKKAES